MRTRPSSRPFQCSDPAWGSTKPHITLKSVVLPAPLGPITPRTSPGATLTDTESSAVMPPKLTVSPSAANAAPCPRLPSTPIDRNLAASADG